MEYCILLQLLGQPAGNNKLQCRTNALVSPRRGNAMNTSHLYMRCLPNREKTAHPAWVVLKYLQFNRKTELISIRPDISPLTHLMQSWLVSSLQFHHKAKPIQQNQPVTAKLKDTEVQQLNTLCWSRSTPLRYENMTKQELHYLPSPSGSAHLLF